MMGAAFARLLCCLLVAITALATQNTSPSGSFGFLLNVYQLDSAGGNGGAVLGLLNFDGTGNVSGSYTLENRGGANNTTTGNLTGTYSANPDGTGSLTLMLDVGITVTFAVAVVDGGQGIQLTSTSCSPACNLGGGEVDLQANGQKLTGAVPMSLIFDGADGSIPITLTTTAASPGIYTSSRAAGSGTVPCPDGSTGNYTASIPSFTIAAAGGDFAVGNYLLAVIMNGCGRADFETRNGLAFGATASGLALLFSPGVVTGTARLVSAGTLNGSYGFQTAYVPYPAADNGVINFDGAGNLSGTLTFVGRGGTGPFPVSGTYTANADGTGSMTMAGNGTFAFVLVDGGSGILYLRTTSRSDNNLQFGMARKQ